VPARVLGPSSFVGKQFLVQVHFLVSNSWFHTLGSMLFFALGVNYMHFVFDIQGPREDREDFLFALDFG
jgi:hypothetical protein